ncbi:MAG: bile acid:sodium symporter family protein [Acidiferrobacterales bacterium]
MLELVFTVILPIGLVLVMAGMGLSLTPNDLKRVFVFPRAGLIGLGGQLLMVPAIAFVLIAIYQPPPAIAIGAVLMAACPGGITSNGYTFASRGDAALSVTLTAISSAVTVFTMPLLIYIALQMFSVNGEKVAMSISQVMGTLFLLAVLPVGSGMLVRYRWPEFTLRLIEPMRNVTLGMLILIIVISVVTGWSTIRENFADTALVAFSLNIIAMGLGHTIARLARLPEDQVIAITFEIGIQNLSLALTVAMVLLERPDIAAFALVYAMSAKLTSISYVTWSRMRVAR